MKYLINLLAGWYPNLQKLKEQSKRRQNPLYVFRQPALRNT